MTTSEHVCALGVSTMHWVCTCVSINLQHAVCTGPYTVASPKNCYVHHCTQNTLQVVIVADIQCIHTATSH